MLFLQLLVLFKALCYCFVYVKKLFGFGQWKKNIFIDINFPAISFQFDCEKFKPTDFLKII